MVRFYKTYKDDEIASPLVTQLSWTNNLLILSKTKTKEERVFYLKLQKKIKLNFLCHIKKVKDRNVFKKHIEDIYIAKIDNINIDQFIIQKEEVEQVKLITIRDVEEVIRNKKVTGR